MQPWTRLRRTGTVARLAAALYLLYKVPAWRRKLRGQPKATDEELGPSHDARRDRSSPLRSRCAA